MGGRFRKRSVLRTLSLLVASGACAFGFAELVARGFERAGRYVPRDPTPPYMQPNAFLHSVLVPGSRTRFSRAVVEVNSLGFRGAEIEIAKPPGTLRIVALGGSTTFGYHSSIPSTEETYPYKLEQELLRRWPGRSVEVVNAGVPGYTLRNSLINYLSRVVWLEPDVLVVYHGINDISAYRSRKGIVDSVLHADPARMHPAGVLERAFFSSYVYMDLKERIPLLWRKWFPSRAAGAPGSAPAEGPSPDEPRPASLEAYEHHLRQLVQAATSRGTRVVLVRQAVLAARACETGLGDDEASRALQQNLCPWLARFFGHLSPEGVDRSFDAIAEIQREVADEYGLLWIDADAVIPDTPEFHKDLCHLYPTGTTRLARAIAEGITASEIALLEPPPDG